MYIHIHQQAATNCFAPKCTTLGHVYALRLCAAGARLGGSSPSASNHFWAPTPAGPTGGSSAERVTLEVLNRRIRTNADMLLDFKVRA